MMNSGPLRIALCGAGAISNAYSAALNNLSCMELVGVVDVNLDVAKAMADQHGCQHFESAEAMCDTSLPDAAIICTPPSTHRDIAMDLMARGIHVLCEKPLATNSADAWAMVQAAERHDVVFTMASKFRFVDDVTKAREILSQGTLGDIILVENSFTGVVDMSQRWNSNPELSGGGVLIDNGTHSLDIMRYLLGPLAEIRVVEGKRIQTSRVEDTVQMFVKSHDGVIGSIDLSWSIAKGLPTFINVFGTLGTLHVGWKESKYKLHQDGDWTVLGTGYDKIDAFRKQLQNFDAAIRQQQPLLIGPADALASVHAVEAAYRSLNDRSWLPVGKTDELFAASDSASAVGQ